MARSIPALLDLGLRSYYPGARLPLLDIERSIDSQVLASYAQGEVDSLALSVQRLRSGPTPDQMLETVLAG